MTTKEVFLEGPSPWGFRMNGGADVGHPLRISRVNPGSKAALKGVRESDLITSINGQSTKCLTNSESHALLRTVKENLRLGLNEDKNVSPKRRSRDISKQAVASGEKDSNPVSSSPSSSKGNDSIVGEKPTSSKNRRQRRSRMKNRLKQLFGLGKSDKNKDQELSKEEWEITEKQNKNQTKDEGTDDTGSLQSSGARDFGSQPSVTNSVHIEEIYDNCVIETVKPTDSIGTGNLDGQTHQKYDNTPHSHGVVEAERNEIWKRIDSTKSLNDRNSFEEAHLKEPLAPDKKHIEIMGFGEANRSLEVDHSRDIPSAKEGAKSFHVTVQSAQSVKVVHKPPIAPQSAVFQNVYFSGNGKKKNGETISEDSHDDYEVIQFTRCSPNAVKKQNAKIEKVNEPAKVDDLDKEILFLKHEAESEAKSTIEDNKGEPHSIKCSGTTSVLGYKLNQTIESNTNSIPKVEEPEPVKIVINTPEECTIESESDTIELKSEDDTHETVNSHSCDETADVCKAVVSLYDENELNIYEIHDPLIPMEEEEKLRCFLDTLEPSGVEKVELKPKTHTLSHSAAIQQSVPYVYFFPTRRYLEVISEENSDLSDADRDKPWENSELIRRNNDIEKIPEDWHDSQDGIDTSWQDGKSLEEVSDVPVISDSHSDSDILMDESKEGKQDGPKQVKYSKKMETAPARPKRANESEIPDKSSESLRISVLKSCRKAHNKADNSCLPSSTAKGVPSVDIVKNVVSSYYNTKQVPVNIVKEPKQEEKSNCCQVESCLGPSIIDDIELVYIDSSDSEATSVKSEIMNVKCSSLKKDPLDDQLVLECEQVLDDINSFRYKDFNYNTTNKPGQDNENKAMEQPDSANTILKAEEPDFLQLSGSRDFENMKELSKSNSSLLSFEEASKISPLKELSKNVIVSMPCGGKILTDLGMDWDSCSDYCPETSEYSCSSGTNLQSIASDLTKSFPDIHEDRKDYLEYPESSTSSGFVYIADPVNVQDSKDDKNWVGMPIAEDPRLLLCVSPSQSKQLPQNPQLASDLLDLHKKFIYRRGYHEAMSKPNQISEPDLISIDFTKKDVQTYTPEILFQAEYLLALKKIRDNQERMSEPSKISDKEEPTTKEKIKIDQDKGAENRPNLNVNEKSDPLKVRHQPEHSAKEESQKPDLKTDTNESVGSSRLLELIQNSEGESSPSLQEKTNMNRPLISNPVEQKVICKPTSSPTNKTEKEASTVIKTEPPVPKREVKIVREQDLKNKASDKEENEKGNQIYFDAIKYRISKKGDIAIYDSSVPFESLLKNIERPKSLPPPGEKFRETMYEEYMNKVAERFERRQKKVIKLSNIPGASATSSESQQIENEFMEKVKERMLKLGIPVEDEECSDKRAESEKEAKPPELPKHLQELMEIMEERDILASDGLLVEIHDALGPQQKQFLTGEGVWSPVQTPEAERKQYDFSELTKKEEKEEKPDEQQPAVWTPPSAGASPTLERKFRTINFQSPPPKRKEYKTTEEKPELPKNLPIEPSFDSKSRLVTSTSENSTLSSQLRLPTSQNPTITLLQKAREGQLPKGAQYLETQIDHPSEPLPPVGPSEIIYSVKKEYKSENEDNAKRILELTPRKFEGIGPVGRDGTPLALRSEVKEDNQQRWYKRMYDSLHKAEQEKDYVTVRYKTKRKGQYPYVSAGGYLSEPERLTYDSDASISKYATLDRRRIRNKENDFTTSTLPRNRYTPTSLKHAVNIYKNQPGRIEDYEPGHSSISEKETKQWWDEVMDIFDEEFNNKDSKSSKSVTTINTGKPYSFVHKDGGYESDSTLVFKRREHNMDGQLMSPAEQKLAYKVIQKGGEVPLHGLRKPAPERPKEDTEIEYFPISPTLTRIRIHKKMTSKPQENVYYPVTSNPVFSTYKRTARSMAAPSPPKRRSSRNNSTLKLYSKIVSKPMEASGESKDEEKAKDKVPIKEHLVKMPQIEKTTIKSRIEPAKKGRLVKSQYGALRPRTDLLSKSPELKAPAEVKKVLRETKTPSGTVVKSSTTLYSSARNKKPKEDKSLKVTVAISSKGRELLRASSLTSSKSDLRKTPSPSLPRAQSTESKAALEKKLISKPSTSSPGKLTKASSKTSIVSTISIDPSKKIKKDTVIIDKKKREKKPETLIKNVKKEKGKEEKKKKVEKKLENNKKKTNGKKKDKENIAKDRSPSEIEHGEFGDDLYPTKSDKFFQTLLLRNFKSPPTPPPVPVQRTSSVAERAKKLAELQNSYYKSEPSLRNLNVYLHQKRPVSESRFRSLERDSRAQSPYYSTYEFLEKIDRYDRHNNVWEYSHSYRDTPTYESIKERSSSEPPRTSPVSDDLYENMENISPSVSRSPSCRRIRRTTSKTIESISGVKKKFRSKSLNEADRQSHLGSSSSLSLSQTTDHADYQTYILERLHSSRKSARFKELHKFYSSLERMAELQKATSNTDLRPRLKGEEIIDFDRWKQIRNKERAEIELNNLYEQLKEDQREKDLLFKPKETVRWKGDRGLRNKEKSVEDLRQKFLKLAETEQVAEDSSKQQVSLTKDVYKPLWRGNSVANLAYSLTSVTGSKRGRPVVGSGQEAGPVKPTVKASSEIGSRLWSSLSMEQVNALKNQLSEIYSTVSNLKHERIQKMKQNLRDYEINVSDFGSQEALHVRCNSLLSDNQLYSPSAKRREASRLKADSIGTLPSWKSQLPLSEGEKKKISMSISAEIKDRVKKRKHGSLVIPRETLGAVAAIKGAKKQKSPCDSEVSPRTCYSLLSDESVDKINEKNKDFLLVLTPKEKQQEVKKIVDNWGGKEFAKVVQTTSSSSSSASTVIHLGSKDDFKSSDPKLKDVSQSHTDLSKGHETPETYKELRPLFSSQSFTDLKELFGEKHATPYATLPLKQVKKPIHNSAESICKSTSPDPMKYYRAYLNVVKAGDVRKLKEKFESYDDIYNFLHTVQNIENDSVKKKFQSDPDLTRDYLSRRGGELSRVIVKGQEVGDVQWLRKKYEPRKLSPVPFKVEDRFMPRINVISKTASLQRRSRTAPPKLESSKTGNVERLRRFFETQGVSILGQMYTSTPEITELRDIAPYLECDWIAHKSPQSYSPRKKRLKPRPSSVSPVRQSILKHTDIFANQPFDPEMHRPLYRYQPDYDTRWQHRSCSLRPTVKFKEPLGNPIPTPPRDPYARQGLRRQESPHRYLESEVNIHYRSPIRQEAKVAWPEEELAQKQAEVMRRIYQEQRRTKYLNELQDMYSRRHTDNFIPSQKSPIPLNRYDDFPVEPQPPRPRDRTPEPKLVARALYNFIGQSSRELSFRRGDIIFVRRQIDKNWYEGEHNAMIGLFPFNYVEIIPYDGIRTLPKKSTEGQARAKFNFQAQTHLELSLVKGELVLLTRRVDENWFEGRIGNRKGIFPVSYVEVLVEPGEKAVSPTGPITNKPLVAPASHSVMLNGAKDLGQQHYQPPRPASYSTASLPSKHKMNEISLVSQTLHIDTQSDPVPYRVLYNYKPQNDDELELREGDIVYVMEKCDDGWYVGSMHRNGQFGTFPGNYVERIQ